MGERSRGLDHPEAGSTVSGLTCGTAYTFQVDAFDAAGQQVVPRVGDRLDSRVCRHAGSDSAGESRRHSRAATSIALCWSASTDNVGVTGYGLYRGGSPGRERRRRRPRSSPVSPATRTTRSRSTPTTPPATARRRRRHGLDDGVPRHAPPSTPTGLAASNVTQTGLTLTWNASTDNVGVTAYTVYRNGTKMATVTSTSSPSPASLAAPHTRSASSGPRRGGEQLAASDASGLDLGVSGTAAHTRVERCSSTVGFDTGNLSQWDGSWKGANGIVPVTSDAGISPRGGAYMAKFSVSPTDTPPWGYSDTDMLYRYNTIAGHYDVRGDDKYYGFSVYFPSGAAYQPKPGAYDYLFELHGNTDGQAPVKIGVDTNGSNADSFKLELHVDDVSPAGAWNRR